MALLAPVLANLPGIVGGVEAIMDYNKRSRAAGNGLSARGYKLKSRMGMGLLVPGKRGGRIRQARRVRGVRRRGGRIHRKRRVGRGFASDFMSNIPIIGPILGGIGRAIGLGMKRRRSPKLLMLQTRGRGLSPMYPATMRRRLGSGLLAPAGGLLAPAGGKMRRAHYRYVKSAKKGGAIKRVLVRKHKVRRGGYVPYTF